MSRLTWRERVGGLGFFLVGSVGMLYSVTQWGMSVPLLTALFGVLTFGGGLIIRGRLNAFYYLLPVIGILALFEMVVLYLNQGLTTLTLAFVLLGFVSFGKAFQVYRLLQADRGT